MLVEYMQDDIEGYYANCFFLCEALKRQMGRTMNKYKREREIETERKDAQSQRYRLSSWSPKGGEAKKPEFTLRRHRRMFAFATSSK
jgi:hypothetical protein